MRCCNCGLDMSKMLRYEVSSLSLDLQTKLAQWLSVEVELADGLLCKQCFTLLSSDDTKERVLGHNMVCSGCGTSVMRKQYKVVQPDSSDPVLTYYSIPNSNCDKKIYMCRPCILRCRHWLIRNAGRQENQSTANGMGEDPITEEVTNTTEQEELTDTQNEENETVPKTIKPVYLMLPKYKRALDTPSQCIFKDCNRDNLRRIPDCVKRVILMEHSIYIPRNARVCKAHLYANRWHDLPQNVKTLSYFAATHIEDLIGICNSTGVVLTEMQKYDRR